VRRVVLGARRLAVEQAMLPGWRCVTVAGKTYPTIVPERGAGVEGVLVRGLDAVAARRLRRYETNEYDAMEIEVRAASGKPRRAWVFVAPARLLGPRWSFDAWRRRHKRRFLAGLTRQKSAPVAPLAGLAR
jgi:hypothetical protein